MNSVENGDPTLSNGFQEIETSITLSYQSSNEVEGGGHGRGCIKLTNHFCKNSRVSCSENALFEIQLSELNAFAYQILNLHTSQVVQIRISLWRLMIKAKIVAKFDYGIRWLFMLQQTTETVPQTHTQLVVHNSYPFTMVCAEKSKFDVFSAQNCIQPLSSVQNF